MRFRECWRCLRVRNSRCARQGRDGVRGRGVNGAWFVLIGTANLVSGRTGARSGDAFIPPHFGAGDPLLFDGSGEPVVLGGLEQKIKVAHIRMCHSRKPFVAA